MGKPLLTWAPTYWSSCTVTATNLTGTLSDLLEPDEGSYCTATAPGNVVVKIDMGSAKAIDLLALAGELMSGLSFILQSSSDDSNWNTITASTSSFANDLANVIQFSSTQTYRYFRITITSAPANFRLYHIAANGALTWPYMMDGFDAIAYKVDATVLTSPQGHLIGMQRNGCTRSLAINFGQLTASEVAPVLSLFDECIRTPQGFFFMPDAASASTFFGYADMGKTYGATQRMGGLYEPAPIDFNARVP